MASAGTCASSLLPLNLPRGTASVQFLPPLTLPFMAESLAERFLANIRAHRDERADGQSCGYRMEWFTYDHVLEMALQFASDLEARGIGKCDRLMLWGENCAEWVAAFFGCALSGVVVVPMDDGASAEFAGRVAGQGRSEERR